MTKKNVITLLIILIISSVLFAIIYAIGTISGSYEEEKSEYIDLQLLTDYQSFFSVSSAINDIYVQASNNNDSYVKNILYTKSNNLNLANYLDYCFSAREIYVISKGKLYNYYVKGERRAISAEEISIIKEYFYYILYYNILDGKYMIEEINEEEYSQYASNNKKIVYKTIKNNGDNNFKFVNVNEENIALAYFNDYLNNIFVDRELAYNSLSNDLKIKYPTYQDFNVFINNNIEYFTTLSLKKYNVTKSIYAYIDNYENEYKFNVSGIYKYTVDVEYKID